MRQNRLRVFFTRGKSVLLLFFLGLVDCSGSDSAAQETARDQAPFDAGVSDAPADVSEAQLESDPRPKIPPWSLLDFNPKSPKFNQVYGLEAFRGKPIVIAMVAGSCGFCLQQLSELSRLQKELRDEHYDVAFVAINDSYSCRKLHQDWITVRVDFPCFQDTRDISAITRHAAQKDDIMIYDRRGRLAESWGRGSKGIMILFRPEGYKLLKESIINTTQKQ